MPFLPVLVNTRFALACPSSHVPALLSTPTQFSFALARSFNLLCSCSPCPPVRPNSFTIRLVRSSWSAPTIGVIASTYLCKDCDRSGTGRRGRLSWSWRMHPTAPRWSEAITVAAKITRLYMWSIRAFQQTTFNAKLFFACDNDAQSSPRSTAWSLRHRGLSERADCAGELSRSSGQPWPCTRYGGRVRSEPALSRRRPGPNQW